MTSKATFLSGLFRKEAIEEQNQRLSGSVCLTQPFSMKLSVLVLMIIAGLLISFLFNAQYTRKETVSGYLRPDKGMLKIDANRHARIQKLHVGLGDKVAEGDILAILISAEELNAKIIAELTTQISLLESEATLYTRLLAGELEHVKKNLQMLVSTHANKKRQLLLQNEKLSLLETQHHQYTKLHKRGFMSTVALQQKQHQLITLKQDVAALENQVLDTLNQRLALEFKKNNLPEQTRLNQDQLENRRSELNQRLKQTRGALHHNVLAPTAGRIAAMEVVEGERVTHQQTLLKILPANSELIAELLLPTRTAGFIKTGQSTHLRLEAFPHQRFGSLPGEIFSINTAVISPQDARLPIAVREPVYRLQARLNSQSMQAYGSRFDLKSGMLLQADIVLDTRSLIDWILDPIYSLHGRMQ